MTSSTFQLRSASTARLGSRFDLKSSKLFGGSGITAGHRGPVVTTEKDVQVAGGLSLRFSHSLPAEIFVLRGSIDDQMLAVGCSDGDIRLYHWNTGAYINTLSADNCLVPCTNMVFGTEAVSTVTGDRNLLTASYADGTVRVWHTTSGSLVRTTNLAVGDGAATTELLQTLAIDYTADGKWLAASGTDCAISMMDSCTGAVAHRMSLRSDDEPAHSNRIFSVKCHPGDSNLLLSGGWDNTVQLWDLRTRFSVSSLYGPHICGESLDINPADGDTILTGSYSKRDPLQLWSLRAMSAMPPETIQWSSLDDSLQASPPPGQASAVTASGSSCLLYAASFSRSTPRFIMACGDLNNMAKVFRADTKRCVGAVSKLSSAMYTVTMNRAANMVACGGGSKELLLFNFDANASSDFAH